MAKSKVNKQRFDPYKNFKFRVKAIEPVATRSDVAEQAATHLDQIVEHAKKEGSPTSALLIGEKGTGKRTAVEAIAGELGLEIYRIDLSSVVSKYIGETEKNLGQLFDAAEGNKAVLYFREADALFGKRSEVKDSNDRYANVAIDYLLQRIESFGGPVIFATKRKENIDKAFLRRLNFVIEFPSSDA